MNTQYSQQNKQSGAMLLEALISMLIFMIGILAIVGLQAAAMKNVGDAKFRSEASLLVNQLLGQMMVSNRTLGALQTNFQGPSGAAYTAWLAKVQAPTTGLPGTTGLPPTVTIVPTPSTSTTAPSSQVTVTIFWKAPNEPTHQYIAVAQIS